jgi:hypothetical protein
MAIPAPLACLPTVSTSHISAWLRGSRITWAPVARLAIHLEMAREMKDPPIPYTAEKIKSAWRSRSTPCSSRRLSTPRSWRTMPSTTRTAMLVARKRTTRFIDGLREKLRHRLRGRVRGPHRPPMM